MKAVTLFFCLLFSLATLAQQQTTKILLIGTIHFETPHKDAFELKVEDFLSDKRQKELEDFTNALAQTKATKVMIERPFSEQQSSDSLYHLYVKGQYKMPVTEREQIGFRLAKKLALQQVNCVDKFYGLVRDSLLSATAKENNQLYLFGDLGKMANQMKSNYDDELKNNSFTNLIKFINKQEELQKNLSIYLKYLTKVGAGKNYAGAEYVSDWYLRNLAIYSNIINQIEPSDKYVILIFGQGHIPILKHILQNNDNFEVIDVDSVL